MGIPSIMALADLATPMSIRVAATLGLADRARERTVDELSVLAGECGLRLAATTPVADDRTAMEFVPV
jgi:hypothetical protein